MHFWVWMFLLISETCGKNNNRYLRNTNATKPTDEIQFDVPDLTTEYVLPTKTVKLEAYKVRTQSHHPTSVSVGYPTLVKNELGQLFEFTPEAITARVRTLDNLQKETLVREGKQKYWNITVGQIIPLLLQQFICTISFRQNGINYLMRDSVFDFSENPLQLEFPLNEGNEKRAAFEERVNVSDLLKLKCELSCRKTRT